MERHPRVPTVLYEPYADGFYLVDEQTGEEAVAPDWAAVEQFAADHSSRRGHYGAGDVVHGVASRLGMQRCTPCAERQQQMNQAFPAVFPRWW